MTRKRNGVKPHQETSKHHTPGGASGSSMNALTTPITATNSMAAYAPEVYNRNSRPHYFFRASEPSTGFLSNWYASEPFTDSGIPTDSGDSQTEAVPEFKVYKTSEHYMMHHKALLFGDTETATKILAVSHPHKAQSLGRLAEGFDQEVWERERLRIVSDAVYWKFTCPLSSMCPSTPAADAPAPGFGNENTEREWRLADSSQAQTIRARSFRAALLATGDRLLVEASPFDRTWGIGFAAKDADAKRERWGSNLLGYCLMDVRERFRKEEREV